MKEYVDPTVVTLGTVVELTAENSDKCGGSGDAFTNQLSEQYGDPHCGPQA